jgi:hypothetical protein
MQGVGGWQPTAQARRAGSDRRRPEAEARRGRAAHTSPRSTPLGAAVLLASTGQPPGSNEPISPAYAGRVPSSGVTASSRGSHWPALGGG